MTNVINFKSEIETIKIENEEGKELVTLEINTADDVVEAFVKVAFSYGIFER